MKLLLPFKRPARHLQRGVGALAVSILLLFASSIIIFYLNRGLIFEQKASANQVRSTAAFEIAEAGIEWATGMLNSPKDITIACEPLATSNVSFGRRYIQTGFPTVVSVVPTVNTFPGCKINAGGTTRTCSCPVVGGTETVAAVGAALLPGFTVAFTSVIDPITGAVDKTAVRITSTGCTAQAGACKPLTAGSVATTGASDAHATVSQIVKLVPDLRAMPQSALTCGKLCAVGGSYDIFNREVSSNGYLVNAGTAITSGSGTTYGTIPGQPIQNALIANDDSLLALAGSDTTCSGSLMFQTFFGVTMEQYASGTGVLTIPACTAPSSCGAAVGAAYDSGTRSFYFPDGLALNTSAPFSTLGSLTQGVRLVSPGAININGNISINGLIFSNNATFNDSGTGTSNLNGAMITCADYNNNGSGTLTYTSSALGGDDPTLGMMVRVPGSWRDF